MVRLNKPWRQILCKEDFDKYPIWVWDDANEGLLPLSEPSYEYGTLFIKSHFFTNKYIFDGYLIGIESFYAFGLFVDSHDFVINLNLPGLAEPDLQNIFEILKCKPFPFFPVRYKADVCIKEGKEMSGVLQLRPSAFR